MNKSFIYIAMAAVALSSCSKNEVSENPTTGFGDPNKISFNSSTGTTRATENNLTSVEGGFTVLGQKANDTPGTFFIDGTDANATYLKDGGVWKWNATPYNWPEDAAAYPITFYAEYPKVDMSSNTALEKAISMDLGIAAQTDLLVAKGDAITRPATGFTQLQFKHILSNLVFKIETKEKYKVVIQSIRVVNTAKDGRTFDYATMAYEGTEPTYTHPTNYATTDGTYKESEGFYYRKGDSPWEFTGAAGAVVGTVEPETSSADLLMQMPQMTIPYWVDQTGEALETFKTDAAAWKAANGSLEDWYTGTVGGNPAGMSGSEGWKGARIEVIYRIYDTDASESIIGRQSGETYKAADGTTDITADKDLFIRVGYPLDLSQLKDATNTSSVGWQMNKRYTYTIQMGTAKATNGILLDPDYKGSNGETSDTPKKPVENPKVDPGNPVTPGTINFTVGVDEWTAGNTGVEIK